MFIFTDTTQLAQPQRRLARDRYARFDSSFSVKMKHIFTVVFSLSFLSLFAQTNIDRLRFNYRETWSDKFDIVLELDQVKNNDSLLVYKTINHKETNTFKMSLVDYN
jgi:hypothetical protein